MDDDICSAMVKQGSVMLICDKPKGHVEKGEPEHVDQTKQKWWVEERWAGQSERIL